MDLSDRIIEEASSLIENNEDTIALALLERIVSASLSMLGMLYLKNNYKTDTALASMKLACDIEKGNYLIRSNLSHIYNTLEMHDAAAEMGVIASNMCDQSDYAVLFNTAIIMNNCQKLEEALTFYKLALSRFPSLESFQGNERVKMEEKLAQIRYNYGTTRMASGLFDGSWHYYENRLTAYEKPASFASRFNKYPKWRGEDVSEKSLLIYSEQGIGDLFQFSRYINQIDCKNIIIESQKDAADIIAESFPRTIVIPRGNENYAEPPQADYAISVCSLPFILGCDDISKIDGKPYLKVSKGTLPETISESKNFKIGLVWGGNPGHAHDFMRSCPLKHFKTLIDIQDVDFFSFQKDVFPGRIWKGHDVNIHDGFNDMPIIDIASYLNTFSDTATCINSMDLMITIDSATAHLAGGLGKPIWMIIPFIPDWRWMKDRSDTKWYDSMRIYRQRKLYDWDELMERLKLDLIRLSSSR
jgi:tetratricopeptide (TPR) repeat protein